MVLGLWYVIAALVLQSSVDVQPPPVVPVDPRVQQAQQELERLKEKSRKTDVETFRLLAEQDERRRGYQETIDQAERSVREAQYRLAKLKAPRVHLPRPGLVYEYQRMASEARRAGQRIVP